MTRTLTAAVAAALLVAGCATSGAEPPERIVTVNVPVPAPCIAATGRPMPISPLRDQVPAEEWARRAPGAKAEAVRAQAGRRMNHADELDAATRGCD